MSKFIDLTGQKFDRLTVISKADVPGRVAWLCQCDCGKIKVIKAGHLKNGTKSCGCLNEELNIIRGTKMGTSNIQYNPKETTARTIWRKRYGEGDLSFEDFMRISQMNCYYCEALPNNEQNSQMSVKHSSSFAKENGTFIYNGLDRIDSSLPHTLSNVVPCCKWCNYAKRERNTIEFETWAEKLYFSIQKRKPL
jgi:hypothetical protein